MKSSKVILFLLYLVVGLYLINIPLKYIPVPGVISVWNEWIGFAAGVLLIIGSVSYLKAGNNRVRGY